MIQLPLQAALLNFEGRSFIERAIMHVCHTSLPNVCTRDYLENRVIREDDHLRIFSFSLVPLLSCRIFFHFCRSPIFLCVHDSSGAKRKTRFEDCESADESFEHTLKHASRDKYLPVPRSCSLIPQAMSAPRFPPNGLMLRDNVIRSACTLD